MAIRRNWRMWGAAAALAGAVGCSDKGPKNVEVTTAGEKPPVAAVGTTTDPKPGEPVALDPKLHQPFDQACTNEIPADLPLGLPPHVTFTGKNCGHLNDAIARLWDQIKFVNADGQRQTYVAEIEVAVGDTPVGTVELLMQPELAPNHVRNFVALATLQYYDGLRVDRVVKQTYTAEDGKGGQLTVLEAGSPVETADPTQSHLGYFVKPEFSPAVKHEEGTVGACLLGHEGDEETAAVRFYVNLTAAPAMDGNYTVFAKVTKGLDVARRIAELPAADEPGPDQYRPKQPVTLRKVTVRAVPVQ